MRWTILARGARLLLLGVPLLFALQTATSGALAGPPPGYLRETLPNGLVVSIVPDATMPVVSTQVWYHVGSANEEPRTRGFAHLFEHLMFGGTASHPKRAVWDLHERFGGDTNAFTSFDETVYVSEIPPAGHDAVLELEADRMVNLDLDEENLANEKRIVTEELRVSTENDPVSRLLVTALKEVLGEHPYSSSPAGTKEDIAAATLAQAREFYAAYYRPQNAHLVVVGPVDAAATLAKIQAAFGPLPANGVTPPDVPEVLGWRFPDRVELAEDIPPVEITVVGFPLPSPASADYPALRVLVHLLAGRSVDPFEEELVRRRRRALFAGTEAEFLRRGGVIAFYAANLPYRRQATAFRHVEEARRTLARFEWLDDAQLAAAKRALSQRELRRRYFAASTADAIGRSGWWRGDETLAFEGAAELDRVTLDDVRSVFRRYLLEPQPVTLYVRPLRVPLGVRLFGWLYPLFGGR